MPDKEFDYEFPTMLKFVLAREGGYVNDKDDPGGETNKGITHTTYDSYRRSKGLPTRSVKYITNEEVEDIYIITIIIKHQKQMKLKILV